MTKNFNAFELVDAEDKKDDLDDSDSDSSDEEKDGNYYKNKYGGKGKGKGKLTEGKPKKEKTDKGPNYRKEMRKLIKNTFRDDQKDLIHKVMYQALTEVNAGN